MISELHLFFKYYWHYGEVMLDTGLVGALHELQNCLMKDVFGCNSCFSLVFMLFKILSRFDK